MEHFLIESLKSSIVEVSFECDSIEGFCGLMVEVLVIIGEEEGRPRSDYL